MSESAHVRQGPDRQSRRHRLPHHPHPAGRSGSAPWPSTPRRTPTPCMSAGRRGRLHRRRRRPARATWTWSGSSTPPRRRGRPGHPPRLRLPVRRTPSFAEPARQRGICLHRAHAAADARLRPQAHAPAPWPRPAACRCCPARACWTTWKQALPEAERIGYPVMLKSTAGGGGIGMQLCRDAGDAGGSLRGACSAWRSNNFANAGVFLEKLRGAGPPHRGADLRRRRGRRARPGRARLLAAAAQPEGDRGNPGAEPAAEVRSGMLRDCRGGLGQRVHYRSAGTVEFIYDAGDAASSTSSRSTRGCRSSTASPRRSPASTWWSGWCGWPPASCRPVEPDRQRRAATRSRPGCMPRTRRKQFQPSAGLLTEVSLPDGRARATPGSRPAARSRPSTTRCWPS